MIKMFSKTSLLYVNDKFDDNKNHSKLISPIEFIKDAQTFDVELL